MNTLVIAAFTIWVITSISDIIHLSCPEHYIQKKSWFSWEWVWVRKLSATWTIEESEALECHFGIDVVEELTEILAEEMQREIDKEILREMNT